MAETAGKMAIDSAWATLRTLRDQWLMLVFLTGSLLWLRDTYERFEQVPAQLAEHGVRLAALQDEVAGLQAAIGQDMAARTGAVIAFPGSRHAIEDARAGEWTVARLMPARPLRGDCRTVGVDAWMIDGEGRWFSAETGVATIPKLTEETDLSFQVRVPAEAAPGRALVLVQLTHDCGTHVLVQTTPRLPFRVIED